jgi:predicted Rossmann fold nucleotide-binding protein DprA/Smf involved in DNA uptake
MEHSEALAAKIEARITELKGEIAAHERALAALRGRKTATASSATAANGRRAGSQRTARRGGSQQDGRATRQARRPRRPRTASAEAVFDALKEGQDQASAIARQFGVSAAVVRNRLAQLEEAGRVSRTGNRRSTRWRSHAS